MDIRERIWFNTVQLCKSIKWYNVVKIIITIDMERKLINLLCIHKWSWLSLTACICVMNNNGMLRHWQLGGRVGIYRFLQSPSILRMLPSLFICRNFVLFVFILQLKGGCGSTTPLSLRKFPFWQIMESPWWGGKNELLGRQRPLKDAINIKNKKICCTNLQCLDHRDCGSDISNSSYTFYNILTRAKLKLV